MEMTYSLKTLIYFEFGCFRPPLKGCPGSVADAIDTGDIGGADIGGEYGATVIG